MKTTTLAFFLVAALAGRAASQGTHPGANDALPIHPEAARLQALYQTNPNEFYRTIFEDLVNQQIPKARLQGPVQFPPAPPTSTPAPAGLVLPPSYFAKLSRILIGAQLTGRGLSSSTTPAADLRQTNFFAPWCSEFMGIWSGFGGAGAPATREAALRETGLAAAQLAKSGVNMVKLWYPFNAWKYRYACSTGLRKDTSLELQEVVDILRDHGLDIVLTLGNNYGNGILRATGSDGRFEAESASTEGMPIPRDYHYILLDRRPEESAAGFYGMPGNDYLERLDDTGFGKFLNGEWTAYADYVLNVIAADSAQKHIRALQIWNEPDGTPIGVNASALGYGKMASRVGELIALVKTKWRTRGLHAQLPLMMGVGGPITMLTWAAVNLDNIETDFLQANVTWFGFHPAAVHSHTGGDYSTPGHDYPGWPPGVGEPMSALKATNQTGVPSVTELLGGFLQVHPGEAVLEELTIRGYANQVLHDVDSAFRVGDVNSAGLGPWSAVAAKDHMFATTLADGTAPLPREELTLQDRWRRGGAGHPADSFDGRGVGPGNHKVHPHPNAARFSRAMRPLLLESNTGGASESQLLVVADAFDDVPTHAHHRNYPPTQRLNERFKIWVRGIRRANGVEHETLLLPLDSFVVNPDWATLSEDPAFRDVDDNLSIPQWPRGLTPVKASHLAPPGLLQPFWFRWDPVCEKYIFRPNGEMPIDLTFGGLNTGSMLIPIPANPCNWAGYRTDIPALERELMIREHITTMLRMRYAGVSGKISGTFLREEQVGSEVRHHFAIAYHRLIWSPGEPSDSEHFGPSEEAYNPANINDPTRSWSNNYGDLMVNKKGHDLNSGVHPPCKLEVVVVDIAVKAPQAGGQVTLSGRASLLPTVGDHSDTKVRGRGAEAVDPVVSAASDGTLVIAYRKSQDPFFYFPDPTRTTSPWGGSKLDGRKVSGCGGDYLPLPYPTPPMKESWASFQGSEELRVWVFPWDLYLRLRSPGNSPVWSNQEVRLSEAAFPQNGNDRAESWGTWVKNMANIEDRHADLRAVKALGPLPFPYFHEGWSFPVSPNRPELLIDNPHTWHPALNPTLSVGNRVSGNLSVAVAWSQYPRMQRLLHNGAATSYAPRGLLLSFDSGNAPTNPPTTHADFGSAAVYAGLAGTGSPIGASLRGAPQALLREGLGAPRAFYQQGPDLVEGDGLTMVNHVQHTVGNVRLRSVKAATTPVLPLAGGVPTQLELMASLRPEPVAGSRRQDVEVRIEMPQRGGFKATLTHPLAKTTDANAEIVSVIPNVTVNPLPRAFHGMAHDLGRNVVVAYGGLPAPKSDTWEWDGVHWMRKYPANDPGPRVSPAMGYDLNLQRVVLFGGTQNGTDTWDYDGVNWVLRQAALPAAQSPQRAIVWHEGRQKLLLYTGEGAGMWEWTGTGWSVLTAATGRPPVQPGFCMGYVPAQPPVVVLCNTDGKKWAWTLAGGWQADGDCPALVGAAMLPLPGSGTDFALIGGRTPAQEVSTVIYGLPTGGNTFWSVPAGFGPGAGVQALLRTPAEALIFGGDAYAAPGMWKYESLVGWTAINPATSIGRVVWKADGTIFWAEVDWLASTPALSVHAVNPISLLPGRFHARQIEVSASPSAVMWTSDGTILTRRF